MAQAESQTKSRSRANGARTRMKILDAAEQLFGARGFSGVSLREITDEAEVTLALASYHFGSKENLFEAVVARRAEEITGERRARLAELERPTIRSVLDAFLAPLFDKARAFDPGWPAYFRLLARLGEDRDWLHLLQDNFNPTVHAFIDALMAASPGADRARISRGFGLMLPAMHAVVSQNGRLASLASGDMASDDLAAAYSVLLDFSTAGIEALAAPGPEFDAWHLPGGRG